MPLISVVVSIGRRSISNEDKLWTNLFKFLGSLFTSCVSVRMPFQCLLILQCKIIRI